MAKVIPFKAYRASRDKVHLVASRSYISYSKKDLISKLDENPYTFLHILNPEYKSQKKSEANSIERFKKIKAKFKDFAAQKILIQDTEASYYVYRQLKEGHAYIGIIACASVEDYFNRVIKKHEATIAHREEIFKTYLKTVEINAEPVCFTYPNHSTIDEITSETIKNYPEYDFTSTNKDQHTFWVINNPVTVKQLEHAFSEVSSIYIADGHHRSASSALLGKELKENNPNHKGDEGYNFFMGYFIPEKELKIYEFNRLITDIGKHTTATFIEAIQNNFEVREIQSTEFIPQKNHEIGMYLDGKWHCLVPKSELYDERNVVDSLDVSILTNHLLAPVLGIIDLRTDERIYFKGGLEGVSKLMDDVNKGKAKVAFSHFPVSMKQLKAIADADQIMPPKSTWIEPKLRSGLTVYKINEPID